jgi:AraC family transcriptional regulator, transcriptional activator of pobA
MVARTSSLAGLPATPQCPDFEIHPLEEMRAPGWPAGKAFRSFRYQIVWIARGAGCYCIDIEKFPIAGNTIYFVPPGITQQFDPGTLVEGHLLSFTADFFHLVTRGQGQSFYKDPPGAFYRVADLSLAGKDIETNLVYLMNEMKREFGQNLPFRLEVLGSLMNVFLIYLQRTMTPARPVAKSRQKVALFNEFHTRVEKHFLNKRQVADYASMLSVSPNYLTDVVKRVTGFSASYHIQQRTVLEAKRLAIHSDANMKVVAYQLGFEDLSHFSKFFKKAAGITFSGFKKKVFLS